MAFTLAGVMAALVATTILLESPAMAAAASHTVGGSTGWTIPPNSTFYSVWASSQTLAPGDTLVFNFPSGIHNVIKVPKASYDACSTQNQVGSTLTNPPATVTLTSGAHYFICGVAGHCSAGQKLAVTVPAGANTPTSAAAPAPAARSPAPTPTATTTPFTASSPSQPATTATPPATSGSEGPGAPGAEGPSSGGSGSANSASPALRTAGGAVVLLSVAAASLLLL